MQNKHDGTRIVNGKIGNTTDTFYPAAGSNSPIDGALVRANNESWSSHRNAASANIGAYPTEAVAYLGGGITKSGDGVNWGGNGWSRAIILFNTAPLASSTLNSATFSGYSKHNDVSYTCVNTITGQSTSLVASNPASNSSLADSDWTIGVEIGTTKMSDTSVTSSTWCGGSQYRDFALNSSGMSNLNASGISKFAMLVESDRANSEPSASAGQATSFPGYFADQTGTTNDPKLIVEHTVPNEAPTAPTSLQTEGQTNPDHIDDSTPEFSAIFEDPNAGDLATDYRIQVATSSDFAYAYWDSGTTTLASTTPIGMRTEGLSYSGSALASSTTYYWRIKFWDDADAEGAWSTATSTFSLASQSTPGVPISLQTEGQTNPTGITDTTPEFSAVFQDSDSWDLSTYYQIQVSATSTFSAVYWDSAKTALSSSTPVGQRTPDISYGGTTLVPLSTYYWRIRLWDASGYPSAYSTRIGKAYMRRAKRDETNILRE